MCKGKLTVPNLCYFTEENGQTYGKTVPVSRSFIMPKSLNVLFIEDFERKDSHLRLYLEKAGFVLRLETIGNVDKFRNALLSDHWDCVLAFDLVQPFGALDAYAVLKESGINIPLLVISSDGEEFVVTKSIYPFADKYLPNHEIRPLGLALKAIKPGLKKPEPSNGAELSRQVLLEIMQTSMTTQNLSDFLQKVHSSIKRIIESDNCSVLIRDPLNGRAGFEYWADNFQKPPGANDSIRSFADHVLLTGKPFLVNEDIHTAIGQLNHTANGTAAWRSWIGVPLRASSRTIGVLALHSYDETFLFSERDLQFLSLAGDQVAMALERRRADRALRESEVRYRMLFDHAPDGIIISDPAARILDVNASLCRILDYQRHEILALEASDIAAPNEIHEIDKALEEISLTSRHNREWKLRCRDGSIIFADVSSSLMPDGNILAVIRDISERKKAEVEMRSLASEIESQRRRLNDIVAHVPGVVWETGFSSAPRGHVVNFVSEYVTEILGYGVEECLSMPDFPLPLIHSDFRSKVSESTAAMTPGGEKAQEFPLVAKDGREVWVQAQSAAITGPDGNVIGTRGVMIDITERKRSERALRMSEERYRDLVENATDVIYVHDLDGNYTSVNTAAEKITGYTRAEIMDMNMSGSIAPEFFEKAKSMMAAKLAGEEVTAYEVEVIAKDGRRIAMEVNTRLMYVNGDPVAVQGIARDITERKLLEEKYRQSQKMEAVGLLAGGISHDFNNLLTAITGYSEITLTRMAADDPLRQNIEEIKETGERASALTQQLLAFSRKQILKPVVHNLNSVIRNVDKMLRRLVREDIEFQIDLDDALGNIKADPGQLEQVIMNLAINAQDAMPRGGRLTISTDNVLPAAGNADALKLGPGPFIRMRVSDTGEGIDEQIIGRIFEPFFTTKESGKGSGLGLSTVHGIITQSGGEILVQSTKGEGTTFEVYLPAVGSTSAAREWTPNKVADYTGSETVLLVEDDACVRKLVREILVQRGYEVLEASSGESALEICANRPQPIQMLLTDLVMPKMSGIELTDRVLKIHPEAKPLVMSGYSGLSPLSDQLPDFKATFIEKPFTPESLAKKVREVLEA